MRRILAAATLAVLAGLPFSTDARAAGSCSGDVGSATLTCTDIVQGDGVYTSWFLNTYLPAAVEQILSSYAAIYNPAVSNYGGYAQIYDGWSSTNNHTSYFFGTTWPVYTTIGVDAPVTKSGSVFTANGTTGTSGNDNNAYAHVMLSISSVITKVIDSVTTYWAQYTVSYQCNAHAEFGPGSGYHTQCSYGTLKGEYQLYPTRRDAQVPGPIAGAGLPALALAGLAVWRRRRAA